MAQYIMRTEARHQQYEFPFLIRLRRPAGLTNTPENSFRAVKTLEKNQGLVQLLLHPLSP